MRERRVACFDTDLNPYPEDRCGLAHRPHSVEECNTQPCPGVQSELHLNAASSDHFYFYLFILYCQPCFFSSGPKCAGPKARWKHY